MRFVHLTTLCLACVLPGIAGSAGAAVLVDFEPFVHGQVINNQYLASDGMTISANNFKGGPNLAIIFDSRMSGTADPDLEAPWTGGNLVGSNATGNLLILAENATDADSNGLIDSPDDQGSAAGSAGDLTFSFARVQDAFGFDLIDVDGPAEAAVGFVAFRLGGAELARIGFGAFVDPASPFYDPTIIYGDRFANRISPITAQALGIVGFDKVVVNTGLCSGVDGIRLSTPPVPEPTGAMIAGVILGTTLLSRRSTRKRFQD